jgi:hypothetical protein
MQCPKCSYERKASDGGPAGECPSCGVIYEKYRSASVAPPPRPTTSFAVHPDGSSEIRKTQIPSWLIPAVLGLIVGYFAGREHLKYELRQTFQAAADGVKKTLSSAAGVGPTSSESEKKETPAPKPKEPSPFSVTLVKKGFQAADYSVDIKAAITFEVNFDNLTGKDIRAFDGSLTFTDLLDNTILSAKLAINDPVSSGSQLDWSGQLGYNQFIDKHERLKNEEFQNLKVRFDVKKILFSDGSVKEFEKRIYAQQAVQADRP